MVNVEKCILISFNQNERKALKVAIKNYNEMHPKDKFEKNFIKGSFYFDQLELGLKEFSKLLRVLNYYITVSKGLSKVNRKRAIKLLKDLELKINKLNIQ